MPWAAAILQAGLSCNHWFIHVPVGRLPGYLWTSASFFFTISHFYRPSFHSRLGSPSSAHPSLLFSILSFFVSTYIYTFLTRFRPSFVLFFLFRLCVSQLPSSHIFFPFDVPAAAGHSVPHGTATRRAKRDVGIRGGPNTTLSTWFIYACSGTDGRSIREERTRMKMHNVTTYRRNWVWRACRSRAAASPGWQSRCSGSNCNTLSKMKRGYEVQLFSSVQGARHSNARCSKLKLISFSLALVLISKCLSAFCTMR